MIEIKFDKENNKAIAYDKYDIVGQIVYVDEGQFWNIVHTEVDKPYQGKGIARKLVEVIDKESKKYNKKVVADCSYAKRLIKE